MRALTLVVLASGCRQLFGIGDVALGGDGATADVHVDVQPDVPSGSCIARWLAGPTLGPPAPLGINTTDAEGDAFITHDQLSLYFTQNGDIFVSTRTMQSGGFTMAAKETSLNSTFLDGKVYISVDATRAFFSSQRMPGGNGAGDIWRGSRNNSGGSWSVDENYLQNVDDANDQIDPWLSLDLLHLYISPTSSTGQHIVMYSRVDVNHPFGNATTLTELEVTTGAVAETDPTLTDDERVIVFATNRDGSSDLYYATRAGAAGPFGTPKPVPGLNSVFANEAGASITGDGCALYYSSDVNDGGDLFVVELQ